jgi:hypothetical protein
VLERGSLLVDRGRESERSVAVVVGKFGTPCERIQSANVRPWAWFWAPLAGFPPLGRRLWHVWSADLNAGELGSALPGEMVTCSWPPELET